MKYKVTTRKAPTPKAPEPKVTEPTPIPKNKDKKIGR